MFDSGSRRLDGVSQRQSLAASAERLDDGSRRRDEECTVVSSSFQFSSFQFLPASAGKLDGGSGRRDEDCPVRDSSVHLSSGRTGKNGKGHRRKQTGASKRRRMMNDGVQRDVPGSESSVDDTDRLDGGTPRLSRKMPASSSAETNTNKNNCGGSS